MQQMQQMQLQQMQQMQMQQQMQGGGMQGQMYPGNMMNPTMGTNPVTGQPMNMQRPGAQVRDINWLVENTAEFEAYDRQEQKNILGNLMYGKVVDSGAPDNLVPKITGMLIDLEVLSIQEIIEILRDDELLTERINEAKEIIEGED